MSFKTKSLLLVTIYLLQACSSSTAPGTGSGTHHAQGGCSQSSDCSATEVCSAGSCIAESDTACKTNAPCFSGQQCVAGQCSCASSLQCDATSTCQSSKCAPQLPSSCKTSGICAATQVCESGGTSQCTCATNTDCANNETCQFNLCALQAQWSCKTSAICSAGQQCTNNQCTCTDSTQCGSSGTCISGSCTQPRMVFFAGCSNHSRSGYFGVSPGTAYNASTSPCTFSSLSDADSICNAQANRLVDISGKTWAALLGDSTHTPYAHANGIGNGISTQRVMVAQNQNSAWQQLSLPIASTAATSCTAGAGGLYPFDFINNWFGCANPSSCSAGNIVPSYFWFGAHSLYQTSINQCNNWQSNSNAGTHYSVVGTSNGGQENQWNSGSTTNQTFGTCGLAHPILCIEVDKIETSFETFGSSS